MVTEYLLKRGAPGCVGLARAELAPLVAALRHFNSIGPDGRDHGMNVRVRWVQGLHPQRHSINKGSRRLRCRIV